MRVKGLAVWVVLSAGMCGCSGVWGQAAAAADHHAHVQSATAAELLNRGAVGKGLAASGGEAEKPSTAAELVAQLDAAGVGRAVALSDAYRLGSPYVRVAHEAAAVDAENAWTLAQVRPYAGRLVGFCSVNPVRWYAQASIARCARIGLRGGLKLHLANAQFEFEDEAQVRRLRAVFAEANGLRMPILIHLRAGEVWDGAREVKVFLEKVLPAAPDVVVQVAHAGGWGGYDRATDAGLAAFADACAGDAARCRNLYFDLAAVVLTEKDASAAEGSDARMLWEAQQGFAEGPARLAEHLRRIGLGHVVFGTDWPVTTERESEAALRAGLRLTPAELDAVMGNVAPYFGKR